MGAIGHDHSSPESRGHRSRSKVSVKCVSYTSIYSTVASCQYLFIAVLVDFHCNVISCALAQRGVRRGAAEANGSSEIHRVGVTMRSV